MYIVSEALFLLHFYLSLLIWFTVVLEGSETYGGHLNLSFSLNWNSSAFLVIYQNFDNIETGGFQLQNGTQIVAGKVSALINHLSLFITKIKKLYEQFELNYEYFKHYHKKYWNELLCIWTVSRSIMPYKQT